MENPEKDFNITISQSLSKNIQVFTDDYTRREDIEEETGTPEITLDTSNTNWKAVLENNNLHTPAQLLQLFYNFLELEVQKYGNYINKKAYEKLMQECHAWIEDETEIFEDYPPQEKQLKIA